MVSRKYYIKINVEPAVTEAVDIRPYAKRYGQKESHPSFHTRMAAPYPFRLLIWMVVRQCGLQVKTAMLLAKFINQLNVNVPSDTIYCLFLFRVELFRIDFFRRKTPLQQFPMQAESTHPVFTPAISVPIRLISR